MTVLSIDGSSPRCVIVRSSNNTVRYAGLARTRGSTWGAISIARRGETHDPFSVCASSLVDVAAREHERELGTKAGVGHRQHAQTETRWMNSHTMVTVSISTSDAPAFKAPISILDGHASVRW